MDRSKLFWVLVLMSTLGALHFDCGPGNPLAPFATPTPIVLATPSFTPSFTVCSCTPTFTFTGTATNTRTNSPTLTSTPSPTSSATPTGTPTLTLTNSPSPTRTNSPTLTPTPTLTNTPTITYTPTITATPTDSSTPTPTGSATPTPTVTGIPTTSYTGWITFFGNDVGTTSPANPFYAYVLDQPLNPTFYLQESATVNGFNVFNFSVPPSAGPFYVECFSALTGAPYPPGPPPYHVGDSYAFFSSSTGTFANLACFASSTPIPASGNVTCTAGVTTGIDMMEGVNFCTVTGVGGTVSTTLGTVDASHQVYLAAYPDQSYSRGGGLGTNSGVPLKIQGSNVNNAFMDVWDHGITQCYFVQAWYDINGQGSTGCAGGQPCPHTGDPVSQFYGNPFCVGNLSANNRVTLSSPNYICNPLGQEDMAATVTNSGSGFLTVKYTAPSTIVISSMEIYLPTGTGHYELGVYDGYGYSGPSTLLGDTGYRTAATAGWNVAPLGNSVTLKGYYPYWLAFWTDTDYGAGPSANLPGNPAFPNASISAWTPTLTGTGQMNFVTYPYLAGFPGASSSGQYYMFAAPCQ